MKINRRSMLASLLLAPFAGLLPKPAEPVERFVGLTPRYHNTGLTLLDAVKRTDPEGKLGAIAEALCERNPILVDVPTIRTGLPSVSWRLRNTED